MKKNRLFILGLVTVFVALVSLTLVSGTLAKYTTTASGSDEARVAYWGFEQTSYDLTGLFANGYTDVVSNDSKDVVAPGTKNEITLTFVSNDTNAPEVDYSLDYTLSITSDVAELLDKLDANKNFVWLFNGTAYQTVAEVVAAFNTLDKQGNAGTKVEDSFKIGWQWTFQNELSASPTQDEIDAYNAQNAADTYLGNNAHALKTLKVTITTVATQLDNTPIA